MEVEMGAVVYLPRALNIVGLIMVVIGIVLLIAVPAGNNGGNGRPVATLILVLAAALFFILSLLSQILIVRKAIEKRASTRVKERRLKSTGGDQPRKGPVGKKLIK
jgi:Kef-type K+ transport system membrane component KefB